MIDFTEISNGEIWELFARDYLSRIGFTIEENPSRGPDGGRDLIVSESLEGQFRKYKFHWLVSCKHFARTKKSVGAEEETNIIERLGQHRANGFLGFYSTLASTALTTRLSSLRDERKIEDFMLLDAKQIEGRFARTGLADVMLRYFPESHRKFKPSHILYDKYEPLTCHKCSADLLEKSLLKPYSANIVVAYKWDQEVKEIKHSYACCKGECDRELEQRYYKLGLMTAWNDLHDCLIPVGFMKHVMAFINNTKSDRYLYSDEAFESEKQIILVIAQRVLREMTADERERMQTIAPLDGLGL